MDVVTHLLEHEGQIVGRGIGGTHPGDIDGPGLMQDLLGAGKGIPQLGVYRASSRPMLFWMVH